MSLVRSSTLIAALLFVSAVGARAESACSSAMSFNEDGAIERWDVCRGRAPQTFVAPGEPRFELRVSIEGELIGDEGLTWHRAESPQGHRFLAVDSAHVLEIARTYRRVGESAVEHAISVTNASSRVLHDVVLSLDPGGELPRDHADTGSLADLFYGFHRSMVADAEGEWRSADIDQEAGAFAHVARHKTLIFDSAKQLAVVDSGSFAAGLKPRPRQEPETKPEEADRPRAASGRLLLAIGLPEIGVGETLVFRQTISALPTQARALAAAGYDGITYAHLAAPIGWLSANVERVLAALAPIAGPGLAVILLAVAVRAVTLPASLWSARRQSEFSAAVARMKPEIASVRASYDGAEQSERILRIYKENGVSPFSGLKGSVGLFLQIPFLLAVFNVTTLSGVFYAEPFLWIEDLSLPDAAAPLPASIMFLGSHFNVLPLAMGMVFLLSPPAGAERAAGFRTGPVLVTLLMVALVYSFASALLLYWLAANTFQAGERFAFREAGAAGGSS